MAESVSGGPGIEIRAISPQDDAAVAVIIRQVLTEFDCNRRGFAWEDPEVDQMSQAYAGTKRRYLVALDEGCVVGGVGIAPLLGSMEPICELQKMYLLPNFRGVGIGSRLIQEALRFARESGFSHCYLETLNSMHSANRLYARFGFHRLDAPLGATGHTACNTWYLKPLKGN